MFRVHTYDFPSYSANCQQSFGTTPREHWAEMFFSVETMKTIGGIIFSNGLLGEIFFRNYNFVFFNYDLEFYFL
jgi:hypothetical protein